MLITDKEALRAFSSKHRVWQGIPGIACTPGGRTFISFYSGETRETYGNFSLVICSEEGRNFTKPIAAALQPGKFRCFDPVLWLDPLGRLWFIWNKTPGEEVWAAICEEPDAPELVWGEEFCIGRGVMMNKPVVLSTGEWLFPIALWKLDIARHLRASGLRPDDVAGSYVYKTVDNGRTFEKIGGADVRDRSFDEHMVVELQNGVLKMLVRTNYGIGVSCSYDRGRTWSRGEDSGLGGPCTRFFISRLRSGRILLINHVHFTGRNNLTALLSDDDGRTFPHALLLDGRNDVSYPDAVECADGSIHITYDRERGGFKSSMREVYACAREILTAKITERDILSGALVSDGSYLKNVACRLGELAPEHEDPFADVSPDDRALAEELLPLGAQECIAEVFERYPVNCVNACRFDARALETLVSRFVETGGTDAQQLAGIIRLVRCTPAAQADPAPVIERIRAQIEAHIDEEFSLSALAQSTGISVYYLAHLFKSVTGITVSEYRTELRLTRAKRLLVQTDESIGAIAAQLGFCSAAYFAEVFSRAEHIPPTEYRRYHRP